MSCFRKAGVKKVLFKLSPALHIMHIQATVCVVLAAAAVATWPLSSKHTQRNLVAVESHVSVLAGFT